MEIYKENIKKSWNCKVNKNKNKFYVDWIICLNFMVIPINK
jgi:hypothetical protein